MQQVSDRERRIYLTYGLLGTIYSFTLMFLLALKLGDTLIDRGQPLALAVAGTLLSTRFRRRVRRLMGTSTEDDEDFDGGADEDAKQTSEKSSSKSRRKNRPNLKGRIIWISAAFVLILIVVIGRVELRVAGPVAVLPQENADVRARVEGIVEEIYVDEGDQVKVGDRIARLSSEPLMAELRSTEAEIKETHAILQQLQAGPTRAEIAVSRAAVAGATDRAQHARTRLARIEELFQAQAVTRVELDDMRAQATTAENELSEAQRKLDLLLVGTRPEEIEAERARLERLEANRRHLEEQLSRLEITSPVAGTVATPSRQLRAMVRQLVPRGGLVARVYDFKTIAAQVMIAEKNITDVKVNQRVELRTRALPTLTFHGSVTSVAIAADGVPAAAAGTTASPPPAGRNQNFIVTTKLDNASLLLKPGMTGQAKVFCGSRRIVDLLVRRVARTLKVEVWSWW